MSTAARIEELRKKFEENPRRYFAPLANELRKAGDLTQAIALCREHLPKQPGHMSGYIVFGQALFESAALDEARAVFEQALALDPENLIALHHLGHIAREQGDTVAARRWYERALETDPRNDDIAHQLAALATPVRPPTAVPPPLPEVAPSPAATPPYALDIVGGMPLDPTPDASMRAVDFDTVNANLQPPAVPVVPELGTLESLDLPEANAATVSAGPEVFEPTTMGNVVVPEPIDIGFDDLGVSAKTERTEGLEHTQEQTEEPALAAEANAPTPIDLEEAFEEGLITAGWPDPADFTGRLATPRAATPLSVEVTPEAAEAFGLEPQDRVPASLPEPELEVLDVEADLPPAETGGSRDTAMAEVDELADIATAAVVGEAAEETVAEAAEPVGEAADAMTAAAPVESAAEVYDLPWLAAPEVEEPEEPAAMVESVPETVPETVPEAWAPVSESAPADNDETSFVDVYPFEASPSVDMAGTPPEVEPTEPEAPGDAAAAFPEEVAPETPAFVTETMGELLVAQGFIDRAVTVYEELVRRRPYDPLLSARLAELREQAAVAAPVPVFTARERFAALAARRVVRRTPAWAGTPIGGTPVAGTPVAGTATAVPAMPTSVLPTPAVSPLSATPASGRADSLAELFGNVGATPDDVAAQALADAFAPIPLRPSSPAEFAAVFHATDVAPGQPTPAYGAGRQPTPVSSAVAPSAPAPTPEPEARPAVDPAADFSFDRFFPDPAVSSVTGGASMPSTPPAVPPATPAANGNDSSATDDLAQFSAWLKGLGKS